MANEFLKNQEKPEEKKMFANKKANIGLAICFGIIVIAIVGLAIWANI